MIIGHKEVDEYLDKLEEAKHYDGLLNDKGELLIFLKGKVGKITTHRKRGTDGFGMYLRFCKRCKDLFRTKHKSAKICLICRKPTYIKKCNSVESKGVTPLLSGV